MTVADCNLPGWCPPEKEKWLVEWIGEHKPGLIVELGVYGGRSLLPMAVAAMAYGGACIGIDPWSTDAALEGMTGEENRDWWANKSELPTAEESCRKAIKSLRLNNVNLWQGYSDRFRNTFDDGEIGLLSIDGNHGAQALVDGMNYLRKVKPGGLIACDDAWWQEDGAYTVQAMIDWMCGERCEYVSTIEGCSMLIKREAFAEEVTPVCRPSDIAFWGSLWRKLSVR